MCWSHKGRCIYIGFWKLLDMDEESRENIKTDGQMTCISFDKTKPTKPRVLLLYCVVVLKIDKEDVE